MKKCLTWCVIAIMLFSIPIYTSASAASFTDIDVNAYYYSSVLWAQSNGVTAGITPTQFGPDVSCDRAQAVSFIWRLSGSPEPTITTNPFNDIFNTDYFYKAVLWAYEKSITAGTDVGVFSPHQTCTRAQIVSFLWRTANNPEPDYTAISFSDIAQTDYFYKPVLWAAQKGITAGTGNGLFSPYENCVRAQMVSFLHRGESFIATADLDRYKNNYDGYSVLLDKNCNIDTTLGEAVTTVTYDDTVLEITKQPLNQYTEQQYINHTYAFLDNTADHTTDYQKIEYHNGKKVYINAWHRQKLKLVKDDKNYYAAFDIVSNDNVYSFMFKTSNQSRKVSDYSQIINSAMFFEPTTAAPKFKTKTIKKNWNDETQEFYNKYFGNDSTLEWGIFEPESAYADYTVLDGYEQYLGYNFPVALHYFHLTELSLSYANARLNDSLEHGKTMVFTIQAPAQQDGNMMYEILQGEKDELIDAFAKEVADFGHPVLIRLVNEMNAEWCSYSAVHTSRDTEIYRQIYRYIYNRFMNAGADSNTIWVYNPNCISVPNFDWNNMIMYYPGDEYVDVIGLTAYNMGTYYASLGERWQSFETLYDTLYDYYDKTFSQPFMIPEFGCAEMGGDKRAWTTDMFESFKNYSRIKLAVWFDHSDFDSTTGEISRDFTIDSVLDIFKEYIGTEAPEPDEPKNND